MTPANRFKYRYMLQRYMVIAAAVYLLTAFFTWLLMDILRVTFIDEDTLVMLLAIGLPILGTRVFLYPWLKYYQGHEQGTRIVGVVMFVAIATIILPAISIASDILDVTGSVAEVARIEDISYSRPARYYKAAHWYAHASAKTVVLHSEETHYRGGSKRRLVCQVVAPLYTSPADTLAHRCPAWIGYSHDTEVSIALEPQVETKVENDFNNDVQAAFSQMPLDSITYMQQEGHTDAFEKYLVTLRDNDKYDGSNNIILIPSFGAFDERYKDGLRTTILVTLACTLFAFIFILLPKVDIRNIPDEWLR